MVERLAALEHADYRPDPAGNREDFVEVLARLNMLLRDNDAELYAHIERISKERREVELPKPKPAESGAADDTFVTNVKYDEIL